MDYRLQKRIQEKVDQKLEAIAEKKAQEIVNKMKAPPHPTTNNYYDGKGQPKYIYDPDDDDCGYPGAPALKTNPNYYSDDGY